MGWFSDDITFCANKECDDVRCCRNPKNIKHIDIPHSFALYTRCWKWDDKGAKWLTEQMDKEELNVLRSNKEP